MLVAVCVLTIHTSGLVRKARENLAVIREAANLAAGGA
jgi:hypothetical protein